MDNSPTGQGDAHPICVDCSPTVPAGTCTLRAPFRLPSMSAVRQGMGGARIEFVMGRFPVRLVDAQRALIRLSRGFADTPSCR
jgi:hypothetical protein